jgi:hypothetical protein
VVLAAVDIPYAAVGRRLRAGGPTGALVEELARALAG